MPEKEGPPQGHGREKAPKTKEMPLGQQREFTDWVKAQKQPTPDDKGAMPPEPPQEAKEPREHGSREKQEGKRQ